MNSSRFFNNPSTFKVFYCFDSLSLLFAAFALNRLRIVCSRASNYIPSFRAYATGLARKMKEPKTACLGSGEVRTRQLRSSRHMGAEERRQPLSPSTPQARCRRRITDASTPSMRTAVRLEKCRTLHRHSTSVNHRLLDSTAFIARMPRHLDRLIPRHLPFTRARCRCTGKGNPDPMHTLKQLALGSMSPTPLMLRHA